MKIVDTTGQHNNFGCCDDYLFSPVSNGECSKCAGNMHEIKKNGNLISKFQMF